MKKLGKLSISPEKIMKNEELINLQGGYDGAYLCRCGFTGGYTTDCISVSAPSLEDALQAMHHICQGAGATCHGADLGCP